MREILQNLSLVLMAVAAVVYFIPLIVRLDSKGRERGKGGKQAREENNRSESETKWERETPIPTHDGKHAGI